MIGTIVIIILLIVIVPVSIIMTGLLFSGLLGTVLQKEVDRENHHQRVSGSVLTLRLSW